MAQCTAIRRTSFNSPFICLSCCDLITVTCGYESPQFDISYMLDTYRVVALTRNRPQHREGFSKFNKIYDFQFNVFGQQCQMVMTSVSGHMMEIDFPGSHRAWHSCDFVELFDAPVVKSVGKNYENIKRTLEREARNCQKLIIWTDCDREGENIGFEIIETCRAVNHRLDIWRARFSEITPRAVNNALRDLRRPDENVSKAVDCRSELDLRIGAAFTRLMTTKLQGRVPANLVGPNGVISYGSCQFPTLGFVVERYKEVHRFIREPFWKLKVLYEMKSPEKFRVEFRWDRIRVFEQVACEILLDICQERPEATVISLNQKPKSKWRPLPMDTVEMEKLASRLLRITARETMKIAEKLYSQGFISYPRTETNIFPKNMDLVQLIEHQVNDNQWGQFAQGVLARGPNPRVGRKSDQAHPPIHPLKAAPNLAGNEKRVYELIVRQFLATCSDDARGMETTLKINIADEIFTADGLIVTERNYLEVYPYDRWETKTIPNLPVGYKFTPTKIEMVGGETSPPPLLTEADLISLMEKHGIGTDATHAEHIQTIQDRKYAGLNERHFMPGRLGMGLVDGYDEINFGMSKPHLRAQLEAGLKDICEGRRNKDDVLREQITEYRRIFVQAHANFQKLIDALTHYTQA